MNSYEIAQYILEGLETGFTEEIVLAEQRAKRPDFPYGTLKVTTPYIAEGGTDIITMETVESPNPSFDYDIKYTNEQVPEMTISINSYSLDESESSELIYKLHDWFDSIGVNYLDNNNIAVIEALDITDRTIEIQGDYQRRFGFDVKLRYNRTIERTIETIETVEIQQL